jgi:hypothetical protein
MVGEMEATLAFGLKTKGIREEASGDENVGGMLVSSGEDASQGSRGRRGVRELGTWGRWVAWGVFARGEGAGFGFLVEEDDDFSGLQLPEDGGDPVLQRGLGVSLHGAVAGDEFFDEGAQGLGLKRFVGDDHERIPSRSRRKGNTPASVMMAGCSFNSG